ncbi:peptidoglycan recognition protein family protein [Chrysosporum ovalisporum CS-1034]|uniref:peptidoglycan recognition protein family protein n=1 Tax=Umezakia ovalisporum TaxID=75695 RepID=UPI00247662A5|nr:peptidoglycan recognition family protein [Umezakia ovalisporum]MDH6075386.1 peptidoglycan recognition protein family protein [Umezakia ovalisporum CS-1034]
MRFKDWASKVLVISLMLTAMVFVLSLGKITDKTSNTITPPANVNSITTDWSQYPQAKLQSANILVENKSTVDLQTAPVTNNENSQRYRTTEAFSRYKPNYEIAAVDPTNYGERYSQDVNGLPVNNQAIIVLHETSNSASSAVNFFQTPHEDESLQVSYHAIVGRDGTIIYLVPPDKRAFGAGNSVFDGPNGPETVKTNPDLAASVNNFAYHVSLETPRDAWGKNLLKSHSGYTKVQYNSLAWLIAQSQVPDYRITTHAAVDRSGQRADPISFDEDKFLRLLHGYRELTPTYQSRN